MSTQKVCDLCGEVIKGRTVPRFQKSHSVNAEGPALGKVEIATVHIKFADSVEDVCFACFKKTVETLILTDPNTEAVCIDDE